MLFIKGRLGDAGALLKPLLRHALDDQAYWPWWPGWTPLFLRLGLATNDTDLTARTAQLAEEGAARNPGVATFQGLAHHARGVAAGDLGQLRLANESIAESPRPAMRAAIADTFGQHLLRRGSRTEGIAHLDRAWTAYSEIGYAVDAARIQDVMTKAGVRRAAWTARPKPAESGWESLTPTEQKVANLIGSGLTNRVVAAELGISPNTVGTHARSVFSKLDVRSRVQLSNVLHNRPLD
jgi:DNA-binding CsgD family transcriptional regulator